MGAAGRPVATEKNISVWLVGGLITVLFDLVEITRSVVETEARAVVNVVDMSAMSTSVSEVSEKRSDELSDDDDGEYDCDYGGGAAGNREGYLPCARALARENHFFGFDAAARRGRRRREGGHRVDEDHQDKCRDSAHSRFSEHGQALFCCLHMDNLLKNVG